MFYARTALHAVKMRQARAFAESEFDISKSAAAADVAYDAGFQLGRDLCALQSWYANDHRSFSPYGARS